MTFDHLSIKGLEFRKDMKGWKGGRKKKTIELYAESRKADVVQDSGWKTDPA